MAAFVRCAATAGSQHCGFEPQVLHLGASAGLPAAAGAGLSARAAPIGRDAAATPRVELSASRVRNRWGDEGGNDDVERDRNVGMAMTSEGQHPNTPRISSSARRLLERR